jgi:hypothetical protein
VLEGRAVQDVFIAYHADGSLYEYGTTIRAYDPQSGFWNVAYCGPVTGSLRVFTASMIGDEIEIERDSFRWRGEVSKSNGLTWTLYEEMRLTRRG